MNKRKNRIFADGLEFIIIFSMIFMLISIYVPRAIWDEEEEIEKISRFRMENVFNVEDFYHQLNGEYSADPIWAMTVVNAIRDSLTADSTYLNEQVLKLSGQLVNVNIPANVELLARINVPPAISRVDVLLCIREPLTVKVLVVIDKLPSNVRLLMVPLLTGANVTEKLLLISTSSVAIGTRFRDQLRGSFQFIPSPPSKSVFPSQIFSPARLITTFKLMSP